ncbi:hypothetical protein D3C80_1757830 [compost metagenome]
MQIESIRHLRIVVPHGYVLCDNTLPFREIGELTKIELRTKSLNPLPSLLSGQVIPTAAVGLTVHRQPLVLGMIAKLFHYPIGEAPIVDSALKALMLAESI